MATSSSLFSTPYLLTIIIFFMAMEETYYISEAKCRDYSFECGNLTTIMSFPFMNSTASQGCGLCMVDCDANSSPKIRLPLYRSSDDHEGYYDYDNIALRDVDTANNTFHIGLVDKSRCMKVVDFSGLDTPLISFTLVSPYDIVSVLKCHSSIGSSRFKGQLTGYEELSECEAKHGFLVYYNNSTLLSDGIGSPPPGCQVIRLPLSKLPKPPPPDFPLFDYLVDEFEMKWTVSTVCSRCHQRGWECVRDKNNQPGCHKGKNKLGLILGTVAWAGALTILIVTLGFFFRRKLSSSCFKTDKYQNVQTFLKHHGSSLAPKRYTYAEVKKMTNTFKISLGQGGYGSVYKGTLNKNGNNHHHQDIAVKILDDSKGNGEEFVNEVMSISRTSHVNIIKLLGYCFDRNKRALIYEFMPNGSLEKFIYEKESSLGWQKLYDITIGIARGLEYLHCRCHAQILHFDIKPHNILLDQDFLPKISDFGLSKVSTRTQSRKTSVLGARGTIGYIAPEFVCRTFGAVSNKSDVYSYGMMVLEMVGGRKNVSVEVDHTSEIYYPHWIYKHITQSGDDDEIIQCLDEEDKKKARKMMMVSLWCIQANPSSRPTMSRVVEMLEGNLESLEIPPKPYLYSPSQSFT